MTTMNVSSPHATTSRAPLDTLRDALRWIRETPAPRWEGDARAKATFAGYIAASMVAWTLLGVLATAALGRLISIVA